MELTKSYLIKLTKTGPKVLFNNSFQIDTFLKFNDGLYIIKTGSGGVNPVFLREYNGIKYISNLEYNLIFNNDKISIYAESLIANLCGDQNQNYTFFSQILKLDCSSQYKIKGNIIKKQSLFYIKSTTKKETFDSLKNQYDKILNQKIILPISGGYDSRLSLEFLRQNVDILIHRLNNKYDTKIVYELNKTLDKKMVIVDQKINEEINTNLNQRLIASSVRPTFFEWQHHLDKYLKDYKIIGFGAESHKGKYYNKILNIRKDTHRYFKVSDLKINALKFQLGLKKIERIRHDIIDNIIEDGKSIYESKHSIIDYINYHLYVSNAYGKRNNAFSSILDIEFPTLNFNFLNDVFSLSREDKENAKLVRYYMSRLSSDITNIDYHSGNESTFKPKKNVIFEKSTLLKFLIKGVSKDRNFKIQVNNYIPKNEITKKLLNLIKSDNKFINLNSSIIVYNYLSDIENIKNVEYEIV